MRSLLVFLLFPICLLFGFAFAQNCVLDTSGPYPKPLLITRDATKSYKFLYPQNSQRQIILPPGSQVFIFCPGYKYGQFIEATCRSQTTFNVKNGKTVMPVYFDRMRCQKTSLESVRSIRTDDDAIKCANGQQRIDIGFQLDTTRFLRQLKICWDTSQLRSVYASYTVSQAAHGWREAKQEKEFIQDNFYGSDMNLQQMYKTKDQQDLFFALVGTKSYVNSSHYLSKGHLAARSDFVYAIEGLATYHYVNTAPEWQSINGGNWADVEENIQKYAYLNHVDLQVFTGTYGVLKLPHETTGIQTKIFFHVDKTSKKTKMPIPAWFWKIVYEPQSRRGLFIITSNNPYVVIDEFSDLCTLKNQISPKWMAMKDNSKELGRTHVCRLSESLKALKSKGMIDFNLVDDGQLGQ